MHKRLLFCALALLFCLGASGLSIMAQDMGGDKDPEKDPKAEPDKAEPDTDKQAAKGDGITRKEVPEDFSKLEVPDLKAQETIDAGKKTFEGKCAGCHGEAGQSDGKYSGKLDPKATKLADADFQAAVSDQYIFWRIKTGSDSFGGKGKSKMKSFDSMKDADVWQVVAFVRSLAAPKVEILNDSDFEDLMHSIKSSNKALAAAGHDKAKATKACDDFLKVTQKLPGYDGDVVGGDHDGEKVRDQEQWKGFVKNLQDAVRTFNTHAKAEEWDEADAAKKDIGEACGACHDVYKKHH